MCLRLIVFIIVNMRRNCFSCIYMCPEIGIDSEKSFPLLFFFLLFIPEIQCNDLEKRCRSTHSNSRALSGNSNNTDINVNIPNVLTRRRKREREKEEKTE